MLKRLLYHASYVYIVLLSNYIINREREGVDANQKLVRYTSTIINQTSCAHEEFIPIHETTNHSFEFVSYFIKTGKCTSSFMSFHSCKGLPGILNVKYTERSIISIHANDGHSAGAGLNKSKVYYDESSATRKF